MPIISIPASITGPGTSPGHLFCNQILILMLVIINSGQLSAAEPRPFEATYRAEYGGVPTPGKAVRKLTQLAPGKFELVTSVSLLFFSYEEKSRFDWSDRDQIVSLNYQWKRKLFTRKRHKQFSFDWDKGVIMENDQPWDIQLQPGLVDRHSYQVKLREDLRANLLDPETSNPLTYRIADKGRLKTYEFNIVGEELLDTRLGPLETIKVAINRQLDERQTRMWLAVDRDLLLVRIEQIEKGKPSLKLFITKVVQTVE